jgi:hypothetical protein
MLLDLGDLRVRNWSREDLESLVCYANNPKIAANLPTLPLAKALGARDDNSSASRCCRQGRRVRR